MNLTEFGTNVNWNEFGVKFKGSGYSPTFKRYARVAELVDALDLGSSSGDRVGVQVSPLAPFNNNVFRGLSMIRCP